LLKCDNSRDRIVAVPPVGAFFSTSRLFVYTLLASKNEKEVMEKWKGEREAEYPALGANPLIHCVRLQGQRVIFM